MKKNKIRTWEKEKLLRVSESILKELGGFCKMILN